MESVEHTRTETTCLFKNQFKIQENLLKHPQTFLSDFCKIMKQTKNLNVDKNCYMKLF